MSLQVFKKFSLSALILSSVSCGNKFGNGTAAQIEAADKKAQQPRPFETDFANNDYNLVERLQNETGHLNTINTRLDYVTNALLGIESGWTQPPPKDQKVEEKLKAKFDFLDCVTYVEQSLALARSRTASDFEIELRKIRYKYGVVTFSHRLHFPEGDWIPENIRIGTVSNSTKKVGSFQPGSYKVASTVVDKESWFRVFNPPYLSEFQEIFPYSLKIPATIDYIDFDAMWTNPIESRNQAENDAFYAQEKDLFEKIAAEQNADNKKKLQSALNKLRVEYRLKGATIDPNFVKAMPEISIASLVKPKYEVMHEGKLVTNMLISHMGFVVKKGDKLFVRHAPAVGAVKKTVEIPFETYYSNFLTTGNSDAPDNRRSTWKGINILSPQ